MAYNFKLEIGDLVFPHSFTIGDGIYVYDLHNLWFNRRIYQPGEIVAEVSLNPKKTISEITQMFLLKEVRLKNGDTVIAENYYVHEILPQEKKNDVGIFVKLIIYSMDKLMTLDKYSKVYAGMKLGSEILNKERQSFKLGDTAIEVDFERMRMLKYVYSRYMSDKVQTGKIFTIEIPSEFIQPYLVQYNESFYDFLSRTANRCGEFLYFEDGKLVLGLKTRMEKVDDKEVEKEIVIKDHDSITYKSISSSKLDIDSYARDTMKDKWGVMEKTNYDVVKKNAAGYPHDAFPGHTAYNSELASDEFFFPLYADKFSTYNREIGWDGTSGEKAATQLFPKFADITANMSDIVDFGFKLILDEGKTIDAAKKSAAEKNKDGKEAYIDIGNTTEKAKLLEKGDGETCVVPFGSLSKEGWTTLDYYRDVRKYEEQLQRDIICIDMGTNYTDVKLGDKIKLSETGDPYVVIQILMVRGIDMDQTTQTPHVYTDYDGNDSPKMETNQNQKIFAIPYLKTNENEQNIYKPYPPVLDVPVVRKAEPQTAFVTSSDDPKYQGRVRIVYPWQTDSTGTLKSLADAEAEYEKAQKDYLEKVQEQERLEKELEVLETEKQLRTDNKLDKADALKQINEDIKTLNSKLNIKDAEDAVLKDDDITDALVAKELEKCTTLENDVNKLEIKVEQQKSKLRDLEVEKAQLNSVLAELAAQIEALKAETPQQKETIEGLEKQETSKKKEVEDKETEIENLTGSTTTADTYLKNVADLEAKRQNMDDQRQKYQLVQQKKEIQEYYTKLGSTKIEDIKKKIAVYDESNKLTGGKKKEVEDAKDATKKANDEMEKKMKVVNEMKDSVTAAVTKMASPWIRMTSPMATDGGGTIFKPRLGDEVLVNYECGNVERPYVVGSLFSKNVLEPDERINREVGPNLHKGASIAIVSPNGHGITFKDPSSGDGFVSSVYPGLGVVSKYSKGWGKKLPEAKDLAGGIKIGDRFGLYSIDMSSDKRSIKISSSLGTVSLNAFTGITISAPNGDIKIEGKNVSIKAGNNLEISSGNNIATRKKLANKFKWSDPRDGIEGIWGKLVSQGIKDFVSPFVDVSLARSVWETILRPVEGTALIKSHRYMKLEAGSGNATIKHDRYTDKKHRGIDDSTKLNETQVLMSEIKPKITEISTNIDDFCNTYQQKKALVDISLNFYKTYANIQTFLKAVDNPKIDDIILEAKKTTGASWTDWTKEDHPTIFDNKLKDSLTNGGKDSFFGYANSLGKDVFELTKLVETFATIHSYQGQDDIENALQAAFTDLDTYLQQAWVENSKKYQFPPSSDNLKMLLKRKWAALFLMKLSKAKKNLLKLYYTEKSLTDGMVTDNYKWGMFVKNLEYLPMHHFLRVNVDAIKKPIKDSFAPFANPVKDILMWGDNSSGQILLSDDSDYTINFHKGQPGAANSNTWQVEEDANQNTLGNIKKLLTDLR